MLTKKLKFYQFSKSTGFNLMKTEWIVINSIRLTNTPLTTGTEITASIVQSALDIS